MKMGELIRYDVPPEIIRLWQERESDTLLPLQEMAIKKYNLFGEGAREAVRGAREDARTPRPNLLIQAPTSSGKTFVGEMAALRTALRRKKVVYLVPLKALAEEKYADFREKYAPYGINLIVSTRDRREFDAALEAGSFSIAIVVYEKLAQLLVRRPERLEEVELVIADELEILSDPERGALVELLLTRLLRTNSPRQAPAARSSNLRLMGLSAVLGHTERLAEWLDAELLAYDRRPIELRYGVLHEGVFKYRMYNEYAEGEERLVDVRSDSPWEILTANVCAFAKQGEPCLVFVKAKHESRRGAELLAQRVDLPAATDAIAALRKLEPTHSRESLVNTLNQGVAFHNADLSRDERVVIEQAFRSGEIKVLVSTSTLAMGMNTPAQNVFIAPEKWQYDARFGMPWKTPILRAEYENMGGRAGRFGASQAFGRSILVAPTQFDFETLWRRYVEGEREQIEPRLGSQPLEDQALRLVASRSCDTEEAVRDFLDNTLTGKWIWAESLTRDEVEFRVGAALNRLSDAGLVAKDAGGRIEATPFGQAVASKGIASATAHELAHWIQESETRLWSDLDLILAAAVTSDGRTVQVSLTSHEYEHAGYPATLKQHAQNDPLNADVPLNRFRNCSLMPFFDEVRAIKTSLFLLEWINEAPAYDIEEQFHSLLGQIRAAAEHVAWLIDATAAIATAFGASSVFIERINLLSERVSRGLREETLPLARLQRPVIPRNTLIALAGQGLHTPEAITQTPHALLTRWMTSRDAEVLKTWAREIQGQPSNSQSDRELKSLSTGGNSGSVAEFASSPILIVDDRRPGEIHLDGKRIPLQDKQYRLIRILAAAPGECVPYETIYTSVWGDTIVESNQMHFQKRKLLDRIKQTAPDRPELVTTIPKRGFLLDLTPQQVALLPGRVSGH